jgi:VanZ family protein
MLNGTPFPPERRTRRVRILVLWLLPFAWAALIYYLSSLPGYTVPSPFAYADKLFHLAAYAVLGFLVARLLGHYLGGRYFLLLLVCFICFIYGLSDEFHQKFVPGRSSSVMDIAADMLGSFLGVVIYIRKR